MTSHTRVPRTERNGTERKGKALETSSWKKLGARRRNVSWHPATLFSRWAARTLSSFYWPFYNRHNTGDTTRVYRRMIQALLCFGQRWWWRDWSLASKQRPLCGTLLSSNRLHCTGPPVAASGGKDTKGMPVNAFHRTRVLPRNGQAGPGDLHLLDILHFLTPNIRDGGAHYSRKNYSLESTVILKEQHFQHDPGLDQAETERSSNSA